jgi:hypothetical protein
LVREFANLQCAAVTRYGLQNLHPRFKSGRRLQPSLINVIQAIGARFVQPGEDVIEPIALFAGGILFLIAANACYTLGWITELLWSSGDTARTEGIRPTVYRRGLILSAAITASPGVLVPLVWLIFGVH